ncbi:MULTISPECIES: HEPN domain-containing protein [unclassified Arthrobacter]|uniref:HEPN domain-containing protein n=1 Tax=unclassified Arthrobacter TaxID=235627 RepID=UPI0011AFF50A|nr:MULTISPECIES: HEPN domain-containing protein [unclassified Arthrobacter]
MPITEATDPLEEVVSGLAIDAFPLHLLGSGPESTMVLAGQVYSHPLRQKANDLIFQPNEPLMGLFPQAKFTSDPNPNPADPNGLQSYMRWSDGSRGSIEFATLVATILRKANGALRPEKTELESYVESVRDTLATTRNLAQRKEATLQAIAGCPGVTLGEGVHEIKLGECTLRRQTCPESTLVGHWASDSVVLEVPIQVRMMEIAASSDGITEPVESMLSTSTEFQEALLRKISHARMAVLLSSKEGETLAVGQSFLTWSNPGQSGHVQSQATSPWRPTLYFSRALEEIDEAPIDHWYELVAKAPEALYTGQERLISAVNERHHPYDGFIDAVIVWENLFGAAGETMLRVCGSLAHVLHPNDPDERVGFFKRAKKMYEKRSRLVHGGADTFPYALAFEYWKDSVQYSIAAWRRVLESESLRNHKDSASRGAEILIRGIPDS